MQGILPVPPPAQALLSSSKRPGTKYSELAEAGYTKEEYYRFGHASAIAAGCRRVFIPGPEITRSQVREPGSCALLTIQSSSNPSDGHH